LSWNPLPGAIQYDFRYRLLNGPEFIEGSTLDSFLLINNLDSCATYEFLIRGECPEGETAYSEAYIFQTDCLDRLEIVENAYSDLRAYPNPFTDNVNIIIPASLGENALLRIMDSKGEIKYSQEICFMREKELVINKADLDLEQASILFVFLTSSNKNYLAKVIHL
jgi:hypothetical protein